MAFCLSHSVVVVFPTGGQKSKVPRLDSIRFPEDSGDFFRGVVEHIKGFGEHHSGDAVSHADVRKGAELPGVGCLFRIVFAF